MGPFACEHSSGLNYYSDRFTATVGVDGEQKREDKHAD